MFILTCLWPLLAYNQTISPPEFLEQAQGLLQAAVREADLEVACDMEGDDYTLELWGREMYREGKYLMADSVNAQIAANALGNIIDLACRIKDYDPSIKVILKGSACSLDLKQDLVYQGNQRNCRLQNGSVQIAPGLVIDNSLLGCARSCAFADELLQGREDKCSVMTEGYEKNREGPDYRYVRITAIFEGLLKVVPDIDLCRSKPLRKK